MPGATSGERDIFYTDDCPFPGQFGSGLDCRACPAEAICPGGRRMWPRDGYWTPDEISGEIYRCEPAEACIGGQNYACADGYEGELCSRCEDKFYSNGALCMACGGVGASIALMVFDAAFVGVLLAGILFVREPVLNNMMGIIGIAQLLRGVGQMDSSGMPLWLQTLLHGLSFMAGDFAFVRPECISARDELTSFYASIALDLIARLLLTVLIPLHRYAPVYKRRAREAEADPKAWHPILIKVRLSRGMLLLCMFTFLNLATKSFEVLGCTQVDGVYRMIAAPPVVL
jgi:hypothetical protein